MKRRVYRILLAFLLCALVNTVTAAQDDEAQSGSPQPDDIGTPGLVSTADNLNLPLVPPAPDADPPTPGTEAAPILPNTPTVVNPIVSFSDLSLGGTITTHLNGDWRPKKIFVTSAHGDSLDTGRSARRVQQPDLAQTYTDEETGNTLYVYNDGSFEMEDKSGAIWLTGYFGFVGEDTLIAIAEDEDGISYAFHNGYYSAFTPDGDVVVGNAFTAYVYDFDEDGHLLSLTDSDGGEYDVQVDKDGFTSIRGSDGYEVDADESGAFELYDAAGDLMVTGILADGSSDEFAVFDDNADDAAVDQLPPTDGDVAPGDDGSSDGDDS